MEWLRRLSYRHSHTLNVTIHQPLRRWWIRIESCTHCSKVFQVCALQAHTGCYRLGGWAGPQGCTQAAPGSPTGPGTQLSEERRQPNLCKPAQLIQQLPHVSRVLHRDARYLQRGRAHGPPAFGGLTVSSICHVRGAARLLQPQ